MRQFIAGEVEDGSVLVGVNAEAVLDALLLGIVVLDAELCAVYANALAENMLALQVDKVRGRPLAAFFARPQQLLDAMRRVPTRSRRYGQSGAAPLGDLAGFRPARPCDRAASAAASERARMHHAAGVELRR